MSGAVSEEVRRAAEWCATALLPSASCDQRTGFVESVKAVLDEHYQGHWYPDQPHRGCAFRSLTCNGDLDPLLKRAIERAGIGRDEIELQSCFILWVNPGEVKANENGAKKTIWLADGAKLNPYAKPKVRLEPTRLNVATESERSRSGSSAQASTPASPTSSPPLSPKCSPKSESSKSVAKLSAAAVDFVPFALQSSQSDSSSDSEGEPTPQPPPGPPPPAMYMPVQPGFAPPPPGLFVPHLAPHGWPMGAGGWAPHGAPPPANGWYPVEAH